MNAGWDETLLREELAALQSEDINIDVLGSEDDELARLLAAQNATEGLTDEDAVPELPQVPVSIPGDLLILGKHKLLVGDATNGDDVVTLMGEETADLIFTFKQFLEKAFRSCRAVVKPGASLYVCHSSS